MSLGAGQRDRSAAAVLALLVCWLPVGLAHAQSVPEPKPANAGGALAQALEERVDDPEIDEPGMFTLDMLLELDLELERNLDLDREDDEDVKAAVPQFSLYATFEPNDWFYAFLETELVLDFESEQGEDSVSEASLDVSQAYVGFLDLAEDLDLQLGRQDFDDEREWLLDEHLDGVRAFYEPGALALDLSATRLNSVDRDLFDDESEGDDINNYMLLASYEVLEEAEVGGYAIVRDGQSEADGRQIFLGLRSYGEAVNDLIHWVDLAHVRGDDGERDISGYGLDVGGTYELDLPLAPRLTLGYAWGSGDSDPDGTDGSYRQTGLQSNEWEFGDSAKFKYYGEAFDPELSNLHIFTAGVGISPADQLAFDLVYHHYRQDTLADELRDTALDLDPNQDGSRLSKDLGHELDLIVGFEPVPNLEFEIALGYFMPGEAFRVEDDDEFRAADDAVFARFEIDYLF